MHFNDTCCGDVAELRSIILKARLLADDHAEQERAAAVVKTWLLVKRWRGWWGADIGVYRPAEASNRADSSPVPTFGLCPLPLFRRTLSLTGGFLSDCVKRLYNVGSAALSRFVTPTELQDGRIGA